MKIELSAAQIHTALMALEMMDEVLLYTEVKRAEAKLPPVRPLMEMREVAQDALAKFRSAHAADRSVLAASGSATAATMRSMARALMGNPDATV